MSRPRAQRGAHFSRWAARHGIYHEPDWMLVILTWYHQEMARLGFEHHAGRAEALEKYEPLGGSR